MKRVATFMVLIICITIIAPAIGSNCSGQSYGSSHAAEDQNRFATTVVDFTGGGSTDLILGGPRGRGASQGSTHVLPLGTSGSVTVGFDVTIANGPAEDFIVFENPFFAGSSGKVFAELAYVDVSTDGINFARFPSISTTAQPMGAYGAIDPENVTNLAGVWPVYANVDTNDIDPFNPDEAGGDAFDLSDLIDHPLVQNGLVDLQNINYIQIIDILGDGSCLDSQGNPIYDPVGYGNNGADIDAVAIINVGSEEYPFDPSHDVIVDALDYLRNEQTTEGGIGGFSTSAWAAMAICAAGEDPHDWGNLVEYLQNNVNLLDPDKATDWERQTLAIVACNEDPRDFDGIDYVEKIEDFYDGDQIGDPSNLYDDIFGVLSLISAGMAKESVIIQQVRTHIEDEQGIDGGWGDVDSTAVAIMALIVAGEDPESEIIQDALSFMKGLQTEDGGFQSWGATNAASTSWAINAIVAVGENPTSTTWENNGNNPVDFLVSLQQENGSFNWIMDECLSPKWMTSYAIPALLGVPYPVNIYTYDDRWTGNIRIEGKNDTIWDSEVTIGSSYINAENGDTGEMETYYISYPSVLGALDEASKQGDFSYIVIYYPSWGAFFVTTIGNDADWWHYWVDDDLPMVGCGAYELTEDDHKILWGYVEDWYPDILKISVNKHEVNTSEEFTVNVYNWTMDPVEDAVVHIGSSEFNTDEDGKVTTYIDMAGTYEIYAEKEGCVRSERVSIKVKTRKLVEISKPEDGAIYVMNRKLRLRLQRITIFGPIDIEVKVTDDVEKVEFYINNNLKYVDTDPPFSWVWDERAFFRKTIKVKAYIGDESQDSDQKEVRIFHI